jgi:hypothetical protein
MTLRTEVTYHNVSRVELFSEQLCDRWIGLTLTLDGAELTFYFDVTNVGIASWQQLRQGLAHAEDYVLCNAAGCIKGNTEHAILDWLWTHQGQDRGQRPRTKKETLA